MRQLYLLQNAIEVYYKLRQVFYYKMRVLLQNTTAIRNCDHFITKMRQLLQNATFITNCDSTLSHSEKSDQKLRMFEKVLQCIA